MTHMLRPMKGGVGLGLQPRFAKHPNRASRSFVESDSSDNDVEFGIKFRVEIITIFFRLESDQPQEATAFLVGLW